MTEIEQRLAAKGLQLPAPALPVASYKSYQLIGDRLLISGQLPLMNGTVSGNTGIVGKDLDAIEAQNVAMLCALNVVSQIAHACENDFSKLKQIVRLGVYVASAYGFIEQSIVANGASSLMIDLFGKRGEHVRSAVGVASLPKNASVEVEAECILAVSC